MAASSGAAELGGWTFLSDHAHVLVCLARNPDSRLRDVAADVGITERAAQRIVGELEDAGVLTRTKDGRRNHYELQVQASLRHPLESHKTIGDLLALFVGPAKARALGLRASSRRRTA